MRRLDALFRRYAADLERFIPEHRGAFACPLCLRVISPQPDLTVVVAEEHVVPGALGGHISTLTCRPCNNGAGSQLESQLVQRVLIENGRRRPVGTVDIDGAVHRAELHLPDSPDQAFKIIGIRKQSDRREVEKAMQRMADGAKLIKLHMNFGYVPILSAVALLRSAYLLMFRTFGYRYVLDPSAAPIRNQLENPRVQTRVLDGVSWRLDDSNADATGLGIITAPAACRAFIAYLRLSDQPQHIAAVILPPPGTDGVALYELLAREKPLHIEQSWSLPLPKSGFFPLMDVWAYVLARDAEGTPPDEAPAV